MRVAERLKARREDVLRIATRHRVRNVRVFGSAARGQDGEYSDVDLLIDPSPDFSLLDRAALIQDLEDLLGTAVDVASEDALHPFLREAVLADAKPL